jgi:parallel beta-helix repeat protein
MKSNAKFFVIILISWVIFTSAPTINISEQNRNLKNSTFSEKIHIIGNSGWVDFRYTGPCMGAGESHDPYVIADLVIDGGGEGKCIMIENSDVFFAIKNCTIYNSGGHPGDAGIEFSNVDNGQILDSIIDNNGFIGIALYDSDNNKIKGNTVNSNYAGISLDGFSDNNIITENIMNDNTVGLTLDSYNTENLVYLNCFNNLINAYDNGLNNDWDNGTAGNYWGDYTGSDGGNGIGDIPYGITGSAGTQDNFPSMKCPLITTKKEAAAVPGYSLLFLMSILPIIVIILSRKIKKN